MSKVLVTDDYLEDIADAIRGKLSVQTQYKPGQMAAAIESIPTGGITPTGTINITENGGVDVTQYATANVNVSGGGGATILSGTGEPTSDRGNNGDVYLRYIDATLPSAYTAVGYLEVGSTAGPYINTGLKSSPNIAAEMAVSFTAYPGNNTWFYGAFSGYGAPILGYQNGRVEGYIVSGGVLQSYDTNKHIYTVNEAGISVDGTLKQAGNWASAPRNIDLRLFGRGGDGYPINNTRIYYCKMWDSGTIVRFFIPCIRIADSIPGMYDVVNGEFYTSAGSGSFQTGGDAEVFGNKILNAYLKVSGAWQALIGSDISDVGGVTA